jgi:hypothetical protein
MSEQTDAAVAAEDGSAAASASPAEPDEALLLRLSAQKLYAEGRANPIWFECSTWVGTWATDDRVTWRTTDGTWLAQLERSANGRHVSLAFYKRGTYVGRHDDSGFHLPSRPRRNRRPRPAMQSLPLPLAG